MRLQSEDEWICNADVYFDLVLVDSCDFPGVAMPWTTWGGRFSVDLGLPIPQCMYVDMTEDVYNLGLQISWKLRTSFIGVLRSYPVFFDLFFSYPCIF